MSDEQQKDDGFTPPAPISGVLINPTWEQIVERDPLIAFSRYLSGRKNVLLAIAAEAKDRPLFRASDGRTKRLTTNAMTSKRICEPVKRRLKDAGLPSRVSPRFFRVTAITDLLTQGVPLEDVQYLAGHAEPRTTGLYDRRQKKVTRNIVERISV